MSEVLAELCKLDLGNRDGDIFVAATADGRYFLIAGADTYHNKEVFMGVGSTQHLQISQTAFNELKWQRT